MKFRLNQLTQPKNVEKDTVILFMHHVIFLSERKQQFHLFTCFYEQIESQQHVCKLIDNCVSFAQPVNLKGKQTC